MSGWIKLEKSLKDDPRVIRMASRLRNDDVTVGRYATVLVVGALVHFWWYADTHIRDDDTLDVGENEIDELVGVPGFAKLMPQEWLRVLGDHRVELPGFQAHNGVAAKSRALGQKRALRHRDKRNARPSRGALPDQDQTKTIKSLPSGDIAHARQRRTATRLPEDFALTTERRAVAIAEKLDPERTFAKFCDHWRAASGQRARKADWDATWRNWCRNDADRNGASNGAHRQASQPRPSAVDRVRAANEHLLADSDDTGREGLARDD